MTSEPIRYKYRSYSEQSLSVLVNRELYFASPEKLNDPYDCQLEIPVALEAAVASAEVASGSNGHVIARLERFGKLKDVYGKMDAHWKNLGVLSLSKVPDCVLMWTHHADEHRGFCLGFTLQEPFIGYDKEHLIIGRTDVGYFKRNPFTEYFADLCQQDELPEWNSFWMELLSMGMAAKGEAWCHEQEVRVLRTEPGTVPFPPTMLSEVVFGSRMAEAERTTIRRILSTEEWSHVRFLAANKSQVDLSFELIDA